MKIKKIIYTIFTLIVIVLSFFVVTKIEYFNNNDAIHIAFVGPLTGEDKKQGISMLQAIEIYINYINKNRNIDQKKIVIDYFDDKNTSSIAKEVALKIAQSSAVAVIGHRRSDCSIAAGKIYKKHQIPAITPTSSVMQVTQDNEWYFRTFFDNKLQGRLLANYAKEFLLQPNEPISIIRIDTSYGNELADVFRKSLKKGELKYQWTLPENESKQEIEKLVSFLQANSNDAGVIFLATQRSEGVKLVKSIKDAGIKNILIAPDSYANFHESFKNYSKEKKLSGYYTEGIYITSFLLDVANKYAIKFNSIYKEKYQENLPSAAFYAVDAARVIVEAIRQTKEQELGSFRNNLRDTIANFNKPEKSVKGTTGPNYFDKNGNISKPISMGTYKKGHLISAPLQLISSNEKEQQYKTVVYTGVQFNGISDIDLYKSTYIPDFYLWFRFQKEHNGNIIKPQNIKFINAVKPVVLKGPVLEKTIGGQTYLLYRVHGIPFKEIYHSSDIFVDRHDLGISFYHSQLDKDKIIYVNDVLGTGQEQNLFTNSSSGKEEQKLISLTGWKTTEINLFQNVTEKKPLGNPDYLGENAIEYSTFNANVVIKSNTYAYHALIPSEFTTEFFIFTFIVTLLLIVLSYTKIKYLKLLWFFQAIFAVLLIIATEIILSSVKINMETIKSIVIIIFDMLWWLIPAFLLNIAVKRFLWMPLVERAGHSVPALIKFLVSFIIYCLALFGIIAFVFEQPTTSLFASGGLLAFIFGLAQQTSLGNIFSGIALSVERSFRVGDWVKIGDFEDGKVVDINWRTTKIQTGNEYIISIPNNVVSTSDIYNFSYPDNQYWLQFNLLLDPKYDPRMIEQIIIEAIFSVEKNIVKDAKPYILLEETTGKAINTLVANYAVFFKTENYLYKAAVLRNVWQHIWSHLSQAGIIITTELYNKDVPKKSVAFTAKQLNSIVTNDHLQNMITNK